MWRSVKTSLLAVLTFNRDPAFGPQLVQLLENKTGRAFGFNINQWQQWLWNEAPRINPMYAEFKGALYGLIDEKFESYFSADRVTTIRLDEAQLKATDGRVLHRLPAHRAFWFGWFSAYSHTRLVH